MDKPAKYLQTIGIFFVGFIGAILLQLRGALLPEIQKSFNVSNTLLGLLAPAGAIGFATSALIAGVILGRINGNKLLVCGTALTALSSILLGFSPLYGVLVAIVILRSFSTGLFRGIDRPALNHLFPGNRGKIYSFYATSWSVGSAIGPLYASFIMLYFGSWRLSYITLGIILLPAVVLIYRTRAHKIFSKEKILSSEEARQLLRNPWVVIMVVTLILDVSVEGGIFTWLPYYLNQYFSRELSNVALTGYLSCYCISQNKSAQN